MTLAARGARTAALSPDDAKLRTLEDNARVSQWLATHAHSPTEMFTFTTSDSVRLEASMVGPVPFDSTRRYPVVFAIPEGPGSQQVYDSWGGNAWNQWLAQQGYIAPQAGHATPRPGATACRGSVTSRWTMPEKAANQAARAI